MPLWVLRKILVWCYQNLSRGKDFDYSDEIMTVGNDDYEIPNYIYFREESDLTAMVLVLDIYV